jgi:hypothetical protein
MAFLQIQSLAMFVLRPDLKESNVGVTPAQEPVPCYSAPALYGWRPASEDFISNALTRRGGVEWLPALENFPGNSLGPREIRERRARFKRAMPYAAANDASLPPPNVWYYDPSDVRHETSEKVDLVEDAVKHRAVSVTTQTDWTRAFVWYSVGNQGTGLSTGGNGRYWSGLIRFQGQTSIEATLMARRRK